MTQSWSGGCQCGASRFRATGLGRASHCHCRMCQKAFGAIGGALVTVDELVWTRGHPKFFASSNRVRRGFCADCGTPLTFEAAGEAIDVAIAAFDRAAQIRPVIQLDAASRLPWSDAMPDLPAPAGDEIDGKARWYASIVSRQHPDHDTDIWPPLGKQV